jgi:hypothetical protein
MSEMTLSLGVQQTICEYLNRTDKIKLLKLAIFNFNIIDPIFLIETLNKLIITYETIENAYGIFMEDPEIRHSESCPCNECKVVTYYDNLHNCSNCEINLCDKCYITNRCDCINECNACFEKSGNMNICIICNIGICHTCLQDYCCDCNKN